MVKFTSIKIFDEVLPFDSKEKIQHAIATLLLKRKESKNEI